MASGDENIVMRSMARIRQLFRITNTQDLAAGPDKPVGSIHYGMFSVSELRHVDNVYDSKRNIGNVAETDIISQLKDVSTNSKKMMDEIDMLKMMAPEISMAETIIVSSIMSPTDLQTDIVSVQVDDKEISESAQTKINGLLTNYFNDEFKLGTRLSDWLGTAGFHDGAKAIMILPQSELDVLNTVADSWDPQYIQQFKDMKESVLKSTETLEIKDTDKENELIESLSSVATEALADLHVGADYLTDEDKKAFKTQDDNDKNKIVTVAAPTTAQIAKDLVSNSFKLLKTTADGKGVIVTRDVSDLNRGYRNAVDTANRFAQEAERQIFGFDRKNPDTNRPQFPVLHISDIIKTNEGDMPIIVEFPTDAVIPVCAPGDNKNHLGYFVLIDEYGQPMRGQVVFDGTENSDITHRLATNAARAVFGNKNIDSMRVAGMTEGQIMDNVSKVFSVAVSYLLRNKMNKDGLKGLDINVHEAVGKALFFNLLAKNQIKMLFIPEPMMVYYRFDHRDDGTGKSMLEDIKFLLAMRCTLMIAKIMAAIDNATKHRVIEVQVDEKNVNVPEAIEMARQMFISKKAPNITNDPRTAMESIINQHLSIRPKGIPGVIDDLNISHETQYGQSQPPADDFMDMLNNMIGQGIKIPPTVLNSNEAEYARSIASSNLFFANNVRKWQATIRPYNKKFLINYILSSRQLLDEITKIVSDDLKGGDDKTTKDNTSTCIQNNQDKTATELIKKVLGTIELVLSPPNMSTTKSQFEELNSQADVVSKLLDLIYPDDVAPSDDLKSYMSALRAMVASKLIKEFLPKLGVHEMADVPSITDIDTNEARNIVLFLANLKNKFENLSKLIQGQLPPTSAGAGAGDLPPSEPSEPTGGEDNNDQSAGLPDFMG